MPDNYALALKHSSKPLNRRQTTAIGLDLGSRTIEMVRLSGNEILSHYICETGVKPLETALKLIAGENVSDVVATGYGRHLVKDAIGCQAITEIKAYGLGALFLFPNCQTVIDIGGQDCKVIQLENGRVVNFKMNDRCAAGTGLFLEVMATRLQIPLEEFGSFAAKANNSVAINSMCTVFAESEVISLIARGVDVDSIALGLHESVVSRVKAMVGRIGVRNEVVFAGGVANNNCIRDLLEKSLGTRLVIPETPQILGALGAACSLQR